MQDAFNNIVRVISSACLAALLPAATYGWSWADKSGNVTLESGVTHITDADITYVTALTGIAIPADASLVFDNTLSLTLSASLSGAGAVYSGTAGTVVFAGDNSEHTGSMAFTNMNVTVTHRYGLGSATRAVEHCNARLLFKGAGLTNDVPLVIRDSARNSRTQSGNTFTESWTDPWRQNGSVDFYATDWAFGNWTFAGGLMFNSTVYGFSITRDCRPVILNKPFDSSKSLYLGLGFFGQDESTSWNAARFVDITLAAPGCKYRDLAIANGVEYNGTYHRGIICGCTNALDRNNYLGLGRANTYKVMLDLNGFDQTVPQVRHSTYHVGSTDWRCTPTRGMSEYCLVKSATAAKLTMTGNDDARVAYRFSGCVSLRQEGTGAYTILNQYCDTTGRLEVVHGKVAFDWGSGWAGDVEVFDSGTATFLEGSTLSRAKRKSKVKVHDGGKLYVTNGVEIVCATLMLGSRDLPAGKYSAANAPEWIEGDGIVDVRGIGFSIVFR
jgi:hypothetical protein